MFKMLNNSVIEYKSLCFEVMQILNTSLKKTICLAHQNQHDNNDGCQKPKVYLIGLCLRKCDILINKKR